MDHLELCYSLWALEVAAVRSSLNIPVQLIPDHILAEVLEVAQQLEAPLLAEVV